MRWQRGERMGRLVWGETQGEKEERKEDEIDV